MIYLKYLISMDSRKPKDHLILALVCRSEGRLRCCRSYKHLFWVERTKLLHGKNEMTSSYSSFNLAFTVSMTKKLLRKESLPTFHLHTRTISSSSKIPSNGWAEMNQTPLCKMCNFHAKFCYFDDYTHFHFWSWMFTHSQICFRGFIIPIINNK